jgi:hypothetical protein
MAEEVVNRTEVLVCSLYVRDRNRGTSRVKKEDICLMSGELLA